MSESMKIIAKKRNEKKAKLLNTDNFKDEK